MLDATFLKIRDNGRVVSVAAIIARDRVPNAQHQMAVVTIRSEEQRGAGLSKTRRHLGNQLRARLPTLAALMDEAEAVSSRAAVISND